MQRRHAAVQSERVACVKITDGVLIGKAFHDALQIGALRADELAHAIPRAGHDAEKSRESHLETLDGADEQR